MRLSLVALALLFCSCFAIVHAQEAKPLFSDDFSSLQKGWGAPDDVMSVNGNRMLLKLGADAGYRAIYRDAEFGDAEISAKVSQEQGEANQAAGLTFWAADRDNCYVALVTSEGKFLVQRRTHKKWLSIISSQVRPEVRPGLKQANVLRIVTSGRRATIFVNGKQVSSFHGFPPAGKCKIGLHAESGKEGATWAISELVVDKGPAPAKESEPFGEDVLYTDDFAELNPGWGTATSTLAVEQNTLRVSTDANKVRTTLYNGTLLGDMDCSVKISQVNGQADQGAGLVFWAENLENYYGAMLQADGGLWVFRMQRGKSLPIVSFRIRSEVVQGAGKQNLLRVVTSGRAATIYVNDQKVASFRGFTTANATQVGVRMESGKDPSTFAFSDLTIGKGSAPANEQPADDDLIFADDFAELDAAWGEASNSLRVQDSALVLAPSAKKIQEKLYGGNLFGDIDLRLQVTQLQGQADQCAGPVFWATDINNYYAALVQPDGGFLVVRCMKGKFLNIVSLVTREEIQQGAGAVNAVRVVTSGDTATIFANDKQLLALRGFPPAGGSKIGVRGDAGSEDAIWGFFDLSVRKGPVPPPQQKPADANVLYAEPFATLDPAWGTPTENLRTADGRLLVTVPADGINGTLYAGSLFEDIDLSVKTCAVSGQEDEPAGIIFWAADGSNYYAAQLFADGGFSVLRRTRGKSMPAVAYSVRDEIKKGLGQVNDLRIVTSGNTATISVNDKPLVTFRGSPPPVGSRIGVRVAGGKEPSTWTFSDLIVRKGPASTATAEKKDDSVLMADDFSQLDPGWSIPTASRRVSNNKFLLDLEPKRLLALSYGGSLFDEVDLSIKVAATKGWTNQLVGLVFWSEGPGDYCAYVVNPAGDIYSGRILQGKWKGMNIAKNAAKGRALTGAGEVNSLRVVTSEKTATLYLNGHKVYTYKGEPPVGGSRIGLFAETNDSAAAWEFTDLLIRRPTSEAEAAAPQDPNVLLADNFSEMPPSFGEANEFVRIAENRLLLSPAKSKFYGKFYTSKKLTDIDARVDVTHIQGTEDQRGGLIFWAADGNEFYSAVLHPNGEVMVIRRTRNRFLNPVTSRVREQVKTGLGQTNGLRVVTSGNVATVYVNDKPVDTFTGFPPTGGSYVGLYTGAGNEAGECAFSNLMVRKGPAAAAKPAADPALLFADDFQSLDPAWGYPDKNRSIKNGRLEIAAENESVFTKLYEGALVEDFDMTVKVALVSGDAEAEAGVVCMAGDYENYFAFLVTADGSCRVTKRLEGKTQGMVKTFKKEVKTGQGAVNALRVWRRGTALRFYVNGVEAVKMEIKTPFGESIGLQGAGGKQPAVWAFDDLQIRKAAEQP